MATLRVPRHVGFIPDGNRRWAEARGLPRSDGYVAGIAPGLRLIDHCRQIGVEEVSIYGFTKENVQRPSEQVRAFQEATVRFAERVAEAGAALLVVGDPHTPMFPGALQRFLTRGEGAPKVNLLANYGWRWDLFAAVQRARDEDVPRSRLSEVLASGQVSRVDLVVRWGGRQRLSGFLPIQCAYADFYGVETLWPDSDPAEFTAALGWYAEQDVTMGG